MILDKVCFIHLRETDEQGNYLRSGGATFAWTVQSDENGLAGDIQIGRPARCLQDNPSAGILGDTFVKATGRKIALANLSLFKPLITIPKVVYTEVAKQQAAEYLDSPALTPRLNDSLTRLALGRIEEDIAAAMGSNWFEQIVRAHMQLMPGNRLYVATKVGQPFKLLM